MDWKIRAHLLKINPERAKFLMACPHLHPNCLHKLQGGKREKCGGSFIPYDGGVAQIREAARFGMSLRPTAKMMNMKESEVKLIATQHGIKFPKICTHPKATNGKTHSLLILWRNILNS